MVTALIRGLAVLGALPLACAAAVAQEKPVLVTASWPIPADALAAVQISGGGDIHERLEKFVKAALPDHAEKLLAPLVELRTDFLTGRGAAALRKDGRVFALVHDVDFASRDVTFSVMLPCSDYKLFRTKFLTAGERKSVTSAGDRIDEFEFRDRTAYLIDLAKTGYVAVAFDKPTAKSLAEKFVPLKAADLGEPGADVFLGSGVSLYLNLRVLDERHGQLLTSRRWPLPELTPRHRTLIRSLLDGLFQTLEDGRGLVLGLTFDEAGVSVRADVTFQPDSESARLLAAEKPGKPDQLTELPGGQAAYTAGSWSPRVAAVVDRLFPRYGPDADDDRAAEAIEKFTDRSAKAVWSSATTGTTSAFRVAAHPDPAALTAAHLKVLKNLRRGAAYESLPLVEAPTIKEDGKAHGGFTLHRAVLTIDVEAAPVVDAAVPETTTVWFGHDGKRYVEIVAADWDTAAALLDKYREGKGTAAAEPGFQAVRKQLPAAATRVAIIDTRKEWNGFANVAKAVPAWPGIASPEFKPAPEGPPAYAGVAVALRPDGLGVTVVVPAATAKLIASVLAPPAPIAP